MNFNISQTPFLNKFSAEPRNLNEKSFNFCLYGPKLPSVVSQPSCFHKPQEIFIRNIIEKAKKPICLRNELSHNTNLSFPIDGVKKDYDLKSDNKSDNENNKIINLSHQIKLLKKKNVVKQDGADPNFALKMDFKDEPRTLSELIKNPAWTWDFELDTFQKRAIVGLENNKSVFVAAHTSAGKTVVAEYAIAMCYNRGGRVIYTSPIKALSNQKYREFKLKFGNDKVGLLTGDIKTDTERYILVMTTEILHNMLKNHCSTLHDLEVVIMDEVHYLNDPDRGHIWEQLMILLPHRVQLVMLSATVPNVMKFAEWLGRIRNTQIQVVSTSKRPVPLQIYLYLGCGKSQIEEAYMIMNKEKVFQENNYKDAVTERNTRIKSIEGKNKNKFKSEMKKLDNPKSEGQSYNKISHTTRQWMVFFDFLKDREALPVICFVFSRKVIQLTIDELNSLDFIDSKKSRFRVKIFFDKIIKQKLKNPDDHNLDQVVQMRKLVQRGIAMHHAGLIPILKEIVEILFSHGYVKVLFATETFAVGVNMPARTVVFDSIMKYRPNSGMTYLESGEFTQMAGRAGRRGLDTTGNVFILCKPGQPVYERNYLLTMMNSPASELQSKFKITYNMILTLYLNRMINIKKMIRNSFIEAPRLAVREENEEKFEETKSKLSELSLGGFKCNDGECNFDLISGYYEYCKKYEYHLNKLDDKYIVKGHESWIGKISMGQLLLIDTRGIPEFHGLLERNYNHEAYVRQIVPALLINYENRKTFTILTWGPSVEYYDSLQGQTIKSFNKLPRVVYPIRPGQDIFIKRNLSNSVPMVITVNFSNLYRICQYRTSSNMVKVQSFYYSYLLPRDLNRNYFAIIKTKHKDLLQVFNDISDDIYSDNERIKPHKFFKEKVKFSDPDEKFNQIMACIELPDHFKYLYQYEKLKHEHMELQNELSDESLRFLPEYQSKVKILNHLNYIYDNSGHHGAYVDTIRLKGRIAFEIESHVLPVTEMLVSHTFKYNSNPAHIAATLSCLMFENKNAIPAGYNPNTADPYLKEMIDSLINCVNEINQIQLDNEVMEDIELNCGLVETVCLWTNGESFATATKVLTQIDEDDDEGNLLPASYSVQLGDVIRCIQRVCELLRHCESAATVFSNSRLASLFRKTREAAYRGVICTPSLYIDDPVSQKRLLENRCGNVVMKDEDEDDDAELILKRDKEDANDEKDDDNEILSS